MALQLELLEASFAKVKPQLNEFGKSFYENLFAAYPTSQPLFAHTDLPTQQRMLTSALVFVVDNLRQPQVLTETLQSLGKRHLNYGTLPDHYPLVGNVLLSTLEQYLEADWTPEMKQAWTDAYTAIAAIMLEGTGQ